MISYLLTGFLKNNTPENVEVRVLITVSNRKALTGWPCYRQKYLSYCVACSQLTFAFF